MSVTSVTQCPAVTSPDARPVVVGAAIVADGRVLATQRSAGMALPLLWEFPGGKVEPGESEPEALRRECLEELAVEISVGARVEPEVPVVNGTMVLRVWTAVLVAGELELREHAAARWLAADELWSVEWAPADLPIVASLERLLRAG
jgi:8-oxo-dGTP diphosphatase